MVSKYTLVLTLVCVVFVFSKLPELCIHIYGKSMEVALKYVFNCLVFHLIAEKLTQFLFCLFQQDLEEQSRLIAASSRPNQASSEGQFVVLSSSQSEESDLGEEGTKRESEA